MPHQPTGSAQKKNTNLLQHTAQTQWTVCRLL